MTAGAGAAGGGLSTAGLILQVAGAANKAIADFYAAKSLRFQTNYRAQELEGQVTLSQFNAKMAEDVANDIAVAGRRDAGLVSMARGQERAEQRASVGGSGVEGAVGSTAEVEASQDIVSEMDELTINRNTVRAVAAARMQRVNIQNEGRMLGLSARNLRRSASTINPLAAVVNSLLGSGAQVAEQWAANQRYTEYSKDRR